jgi:hypothetical protein
MSRPWTDDEIHTLVTMWPTAPLNQIARTLHREDRAIRAMAEQLRQAGCQLEDKKPRRNYVSPDQQDFDDAKRNYCLNHGINIAELSARFESDNKLAAELYWLAQTARLARTSRLAAGAKANYRRRHADHRP